MHSLANPVTDVGILGGEIDVVAPDITVAAPFGFLASSSTTILGGLKVIGDNGYDAVGVEGLAWLSELGIAAVQLAQIVVEIVAEEAVGECQFEVEFEVW